MRRSPVALAAAAGEAKGKVACCAPHCGAQRAEHGPQLVLGEGEARGEVERAVQERADHHQRAVPGHGVGVGVRGREWGWGSGLGLGLGAGVAAYCPAGTV